MFRYRTATSLVLCVVAQLIVLVGAQAGVPFTGSNTCNTPTIVDVPVGPVGSPITTTIAGNNSAATENDCIPPPGYHDGPVWWEAFRITQRATVTIDLCGTTPVQDPSYDLIYAGCAFGNQNCFDITPSDASGRGAPFCSDGNIWSTFLRLEPRVYRIPILSDPSVQPGGVGPYTMHIHAEACPGACCHTKEHTCDDCVDPATCVGPGDEFHADESCVQVECAAVLGPDLVVGAVWFCEHYGRVGDIGSGTVAMACATTACNKGDKRGNWIALPDTDHPVIGINFYRMETVTGTTRFEQLGHSWLKHGFGSANADECGFGCVPNAPFEQIGVGCSDTYGAVQFTSCNLGPRSMINPFTGVMPGGPDLGPIDFECEFGTTDGVNYPSTDHRDHVHTPISHKPQIPETDLDPILHPAARFFAEGFYIAPHEYNEGNGNQNNNVSHVELLVSGPDIDGAYFYSEAGATQSESPAVDAWPGASQSIIEPAPLVDGRAFLAWEVTDLGGGQWHYEYAIYNMNLDASIGSLCVPLAPGVNITNVSFHAPLNHAPEPHADNYTNDPWTPTITADAIRWDTETFTANPMANAVRFGTLYNFRFDANTPPQGVNGAAGLFKTSGLAGVALQGPSPAVLEDINLNGIPDVCEPEVPANLQADAGVSKTRFISFTVPASQTAGVGQTALRVKLVSLHHVNPPYTGGPSAPFTSFEGQIRWAGPPVQYVESTSNATPFFASSLQCAPHYQDWSTLGLLHVHGSAIVPSSMYEVENVAVSCTGNEVSCAAVSVPLSVSTTRWGDVELPYNPPSPTTQPDLGDIAALVDKFEGVPTAPIKARAVLAGTDAFGNVNLGVDVSFDTIAACVDAFRGKPYPYTVAACP